MKQNKAREEIVKLFVDCLEKEDLPWHQGFIPSRTSFNPITNTTYKNSNRFILYLNEYIHQYDDPRWMTFKQASEKAIIFIKVKRVCLLNTGVSMMPKKRRN